MIELILNMLSIIIGYYVIKLISNYTLVLIYQFFLFITDLFACLIIDKKIIEINLQEVNTKWQLQRHTD